MIDTQETMHEFAELYQELILDHNKNPRNKGQITTPDYHADGHNPLCGDKVSVDLLVSDQTIYDIKFDGVGCAISTASASLMTEAVKGKNIEDCKLLMEQLMAILTGKPEPGTTNLGKLEAIVGVRAFPMRVKCATLPWRTLEAAINQENSATTE